MVDPSHSFEDLSGLRVITKADPSQAARILMGLSSIGSVPSSHHSFQAEAAEYWEQKDQPILGKIQIVSSAGCLGEVGCRKIARMDMEPSTCGSLSLSLFVPVAPVPRRWQDFGPFGIRCCNLELVAVLLNRLMHFVHAIARRFRQ